jgi:HAMP domain-containing protein
LFLDDEHVAQMRDQIENLENEKASLLTELEGVIAQFRNKERNLIETQRLLEEAQNEMAQGSTAQSSAEVEELTQQVLRHI